MVPSESSSNLNAYTPWPGLAAYDEASSAFFFGRQDEADELFRLIRLAPLTVVYGKSGLGKTSLLQAGLYPKLREQHYLPIHVRFEFSDVVKDPPLQQVMQRLREELDKEKAEYPEPRNAGSLWEYLHRRDLKIWSHDNFPLTPVLVFDQFEELFTHRSSDVELITNVMYSFADLIENRFPPEVINEAGTVRSSLDLSSQRYRIILSFREDFLPEVQAWEQKVPSLMKNYLRLNPMSRERAIEAVTLAGKEILEANVAPSIVDLVGKRDHASEAANPSEMVIEPVLLSLCCSRLTARRNGAKIDQALVKEIGQDILDDFYQEALNDDAVKGPPDVAMFIEDNLIQGDHFRGNYPKENALDKHLLTEKQLAALTDKHRLLRIVPHPDTTRVELIHDRLVPVVRKARDERKIKQHQEEQERLTREAQAKAANLKKIGLLITLLFLMAVIGAVLAVMSGRRADEAKNSAETAQDKAEELLSFLLGEQFLGEIRDMGRSAMLQQVRDNVQVYIDKDNTDKGTQSLALIRGRARRNAGDLKRTRGSLSESVTAFKEALSAIESSANTPTRAREVARTHERMGEALAEQGHVSQALKHYTTAVEAWRQVVASAEVEVSDCTSLADSLVSTGELKRRMGQATHASKDVDLAFTFITTLPFGRCGSMASAAEPYPDAKALAVLSRARMLRANIFNFEEDYEGAVKLAREAQQLKPGSASATIQNASAFALRANSKTFDKPQQALEDYRRVLAEFDLLRRLDPTNRLWEREQAAVQLLIAQGIVACHQSKTKDGKPIPSLGEAELSSSKATITLRELAKSNPSNVLWQRDFGWATQVRGKVLAAQGRSAESLEVFRDSERLHSANIPDHSDGDLVWSLGSILLDQASALAEIKRLPEAKATIRRAITLSDQLEKEGGAQGDKLIIVGYLWNARTEEGKILRKAKDKKGADLAEQEGKRLEEQYKNLYLDLAEHNEQEAKKLNDSYIASVNQGAKLFKEENYAAALREFNAAESAMRHYIDLEPTAYHGYDNLRNIYSWIRSTEERLQNASKAASAGSVMVDVAQIASLLAPEDRTQSLDENLRNAHQAQGLALYNSKDFLQHIDETLAAVQKEIVYNETTLQKDPINVHHLSALANAHFGHGLVRRRGRKDGWEEAIRIGIVYIQNAADIGRKNPKYLNELGGYRKYLADELDADGLTDKAREEYRLALEAYNKAAHLSPDDKETRDAIRELKGREIR